MGGQWWLVSPMLHDPLVCTVLKELQPSTALNVEVVLETSALTHARMTSGRSPTICEPCRVQRRQSSQYLINMETKMLCTSKWPLLNIFVLLSLYMESNLQWKMRQDAGLTFRPVGAHPGEPGVKARILPSCTWTHHKTCQEAGWGGTYESQVCHGRRTEVCLDGPQILVSCITYRGPVPWCVLKPPLLWILEMA